MPDVASAIAERTFHLNSDERWHWDRADELSRRTIEGNARKRAIDEREMDASRAEEARRLDAAIETACLVASAAIPSLGALRDQLSSNPDLPGLIRARVVDAYQALRRLPNAPFQRLDALYRVHEAQLRDQPSVAHVVQLWLQFEKQLAELSAQRRQWTAMSFSDAQSAYPARPGVVFDPVRFLATLAARGAILTLREGRLVCMPGLLDEQAKRMIEKHRLEIVGALSQLEEF